MRRDRYVKIHIEMIAMLCCSLTGTVVSNVLTNLFQLTIPLIAAVELSHFIILVCTNWPKIVLSTRRKWSRPRRWQFCRDETHATRRYSVALDRFENENWEVHNPVHDSHKTCLWRVGPFCDLLYLFIKANTAARRSSEPQENVRRPSSVC